MPPLSPLAHVARGDPVKARAVHGKGVLYLKYAAMALRAGGKYILALVTILRTKYAGGLSATQKSAEKQYFNSSK